MNIKLIKQYVESYKNNFEYISGKELYKWKAVKQFQENWEIDHTNFPEMLENSLLQTDNLLLSGQYFPRGMIMHLSDAEPETMRELFRKLYDENSNLEERINYFKETTFRINQDHFPDKKNTYQDFGAIIVYLVLKYPEKYYLYKFEMYSKFAKKLHLSFKPKAGQIETLYHYNKVCDIVRHRISLDQELIKLHKERITNECYYDENLHLLTQDFIYAVVQHLEDIVDLEKNKKPILIETPVISSKEIIQNEDNVNFSERFVNYIENSIEAKRIGDLGEIWVYEREINKLKTNGLDKLANKIKHVANDNGDGAGFDIESYDLNGRKIYIEVKTTKNNFNTPFFISRNELERSKREKECYFIYRVFNYDEETNDAECKIIQGDLSSLCTNPTVYKVNLKSKDTIA